jgi:hypothetical protein
MFSSPLSLGKGHARATQGWEWVGTKQTMST